MRRWQEPGDLNWSEPSALLKLACCRAGSALVQRHHQFNIIIIMIFIEGVGGACVQASKQAGESESARQHRGGEFSRGRQGLQTRTRHRAFALARWWKLQNNRDASLPTLPRHGERAERALGCPDLSYSGSQTDCCTYSVLYWCSVLLISRGGDLQAQP